MAARDVTAVTAMIRYVRNVGSEPPRLRAKYLPAARVFPVSLESQPSRDAISALCSLGARRSHSRYASRAPLRSPERTRAAATWRQALYVTGVSPTDVACSHALSASSSRSIR